MRQFKINSHDNYPIFVTIWDDVKEPKAVLQLVHGMSEYAECYDDYAKYMNENGYIVFADDHRAHGRTETDENRGNHEGNIFKKTLQDELFFREWIKKEYPNLPIVMLGHSYGSFLLQAIAEEKTDIKAIALVGSGYVKAQSTLATILLAPLELICKNSKLKIVDWASANLFHYKGDKGSSQWLNSLPEERHKLAHYRYMCRGISVNFDYQFMNEARKLYSKKALANLNHDIHIAIFSGDADPIGNYGKGLDKLEKMYIKEGIPCEKHIYPGSRHTLLFDKDKVQARKDVLDYFNKFI